MKEILFKGCGTAIVTPFTDTGVNFKEFEKLIEFQINEGINALIVCGTTGEASTMSTEEKKETIKFATRVTKKRVPVIAGTGGNNTKAAIEMSKYAESVGADGLLIVTPYYNKTTQDGLIEHYRVIAESVSLPIIVYSVPSRTGLNVEPKTCLKLSKIENIVAIKEASGNISQVAKIASLCGDNLNIYSGNDDQVLPLLSLGGIGVISVVSNIAPRKFTNMLNTYFEGNIEEAIRMQLESIPLVDALFCEVNPIPVKAGLNLMGYNMGIPRLPLVEMTQKGKEQLKEAMRDYGIEIK